MNQIPQLYRIGPHLLHISGSVPLEPSALLPSFAPFVCPEQAGLVEGVIRVGIRSCKAVPEAGTSGWTPVSFEWENARCTITRPDNDTYHINIALLENLSIPACAECDSTFLHNTLYIPDALQSVAPFLVSNFLMMIYTFATAPRHTLLVHASVVSYRGKGYLFLGKSGTGKSTHTALWLRHIAGSCLLNDDNPLVAIDPATGTVTVHGSPWSGKTPCYLNEQVPISAFVRLEQAPRNHIARLTDSHAFAALLPSCSCLKQDERIYRGVIDTVTRVVTRVPVFHLQCLPDEAAARLCQQTVTQTGGQP